MTNEIIYSSRVLNDTLSNKAKRVLSSLFVFFVVSVAAISMFQFINATLVSTTVDGASSSFNQILNVSSDYSGWTKMRISIVFSTAPAVLLVLGFFGFLKFLSDKKNEELSLLSLAGLWICVIFINFFLTLLLVGFAGKLSYEWSLYQSLAVVFAWWRFHQVMLVPIAFVSLISSILFGYLIAFSFLSFSYSNSLILNFKGRFHFLLQIFFLPFVIGSLAVLTLSTQYSFLLYGIVFSNISLVFMGMLLRCETDKFGAFTNGKDVLNNLAIGWPILAGVLWILIFFFYR